MQHTTTETVHNDDFLEKRVNKNMQNRSKITQTEQTGKWFFTKKNIKIVHERINQIL